jgi:hypothetical protein
MPLQQKIDLNNNIYLDCIFSSYLSIDKNDIIISYNNEQYVFHNLFTGGQIVHCEHNGKYIFFSYIFNNITSVISFDVTYGVTLDKNYRGKNIILPYRLNENLSCMCDKIKIQNMAALETDDIKFMHHYNNGNFCVTVYKNDWDMYLSYCNRIINKWDKKYYKFLNVLQKNQILILLLFNKYYLHGFNKVPKYILQNIIFLLIVIC